MPRFFLFWHLVGHSYIYNIADIGTTSMRKTLYAILSFMFIAKCINF